MTRRSVFADFDQLGNFLGFNTEDGSSPFSGSTGQVIFNLPKGTGGNDGPAWRAVIDQAMVFQTSAKLTQTNPYRVIVNAPDGVVFVDYMTWRSDIDYRWNGAWIKKFNDGTGNLDSTNNSIIKAAYAVVGGSRFGQMDNIRSSGGLWDCNNKSCGSGIINAWHARNCSFSNMAIQQASVPWAGGFSFLYCGDNLSFDQITGLGGLYVGHDFLHGAGGDGHRVTRCYGVSGDDCYAWGAEPWMVPYMDDIIIQNVSGHDNVAKAMRGNACSAYYPKGGLTGQRGRIRGVNFQCVGESGILRNGGALIYNEQTSSIDRTAIEDVLFDVDLAVGSATHDGFNAFGSQIINVTNCAVTGRVRLIDITTASHGVQRVITNGVLYNSLAGYAVGVTVTATISIDGGTAIPLTWTGAAGQKVGDVLTYLQSITTLTAVGAVDLIGGNFWFTSNSTGTASTVNIVDSGFFSTMANYNSLEAAVAGKIPYSQDQVLGSIGLVLGNVSSNNRVVWGLSCDQIGAYEGILIFNTPDFIMLPGGRIGGMVANRAAVKLVPGGTTTSIFASQQTWYSATANAIGLNAPVDAGVSRLAHITLTDSDLSGVTAKVSGLTGGNGTYALDNNKGLLDNTLMYPTFSVRPAANSTLLGAKVRLKVGMAGYHDFISDQSVLRAVGGQIVMGQGVGVQVTGTTAKTTLMAKAIAPMLGGLMGTLGRIEVEIDAVTTLNNANSKLLTIEFGGQVVGTIDLANNTRVRGRQVIWNQNATGVQSFLPGIGEGSGLSTASLGAATVDTTVDQTLVIYATLANAGDNLRLAGYKVTFIDAS